MPTNYLYWQFLSAPAWLLVLMYNFQHALIRFFSVPVMLRTLVSHWHKDVVKYSGSISNRFLILGWNMISRVIGFLIRSVVLFLWVTSATVLLVGSIALFAVFVLWPFLVIAGLIWSLMQL